jgi:hypothetical protein
MGVAEQMLLNQVTIFNPPSPSKVGGVWPESRPTSQYKHKEREDGKYAFGWNDPYDIYKEETK